MFAKIIKTAIVTVAGIMVIGGGTVLAQGIDVEEVVPKLVARVFALENNHSDVILENVGILKASPSTANASNTDDFVWTNETITHRGIPLDFRYDVVYIQWSRSNRNCNIVPWLKDAFDNIYPMFGSTETPQGVFGTDPKKQSRWNVWWTYEHTSQSTENSISQEFAYTVTGCKASQVSAELFVMSRSALDFTPVP